MNDRKILTGKRSVRWETSHMPKKLMIKNFANIQTSAEYHTESWAKLERAIFSILNPNTPNVDCTFSLEDLYQAVQSLCSRNDKIDSETYRKLKNIIQNYVRNTLLEQFSNLNDKRFLSLMEQCWNCFCVQLKMIRNIFLYLDRTYVLKCPQISSIWDMGLELFRDIIVLNEKILPKIIESVLDLISKDRQNSNSEQMNEIVNIRNCIRMLLDLNVYDLFEVDFLRESQRYFSSECVRKIRFVGSITPEKIVEYLEFIDHILKDETERLTAIQMDQHPTYKKLVSSIEKELIATNIDLMLNANNFDALFDNLKYIGSVKLAYSLFERVPNGIDKMCTCFNQFIKAKGRSMIHLAGADPEKEKCLIQELIDFKGRMDRIVQECFTSSHRQYAASLKEAFENFINVRTNKMAELIAKFVDGKLRQANFDSEQFSFDQLLDKVMVMFRFIHGKDIFEAFYQRDLAKRLLGGKSASVDAEKLMLLKLKQECGGAFTSKLESMFKDVELSRDLTSTFKQYLTKADVSQNGPTIDMSVSVLTTGIWPTYQSIELFVSEDLQQYEQVFSQFYLAKHQGRKLQWQHGFGHCLLKGYFPQGDKELQVSFIQALVLLQFNQKDELSIDDVRSAIFAKDVKPTEEKELRRTLQSLACGKVRVLSKEPKGRDIMDGDRFIFNSSFENKLFRIKINQVQWKETYEENVATQERVSQDRQYQLDAAIVRIMKARKTLSHNDLVSEIYTKVNFPAQASELKKRIDSLIERDYIRRDKDNINKYHYVI